MGSCISLVIAAAHPLSSSWERTLSVGTSQRDQPTCYGRSSKTTMIHTRDVELSAIVTYSNCISFILSRAVLGLRNGCAFRLIVKTTKKVPVSRILMGLGAPTASSLVMASRSLLGPHGPWGGE